LAGFRYVRLDVLSRRDVLTLITIILLGRLAYYWVIPMHDRQGRAGCGALYAQARTAADTAAIDLESVPIQRGRDQDPEPLS